MRANFVKVIHPGKTTEGWDVFCEIKFKEGKLSITGVIGPTRDGNCKGSCGQIDVAATVARVARGWTLDMVGTFGSLWDRWHLNDMRAGCEHQRAAGWGEEEIEVVTYELSSAAMQRRGEVIDMVCASAHAGQMRYLTSCTDRALLSPDWFKPIFSLPEEGSPLAGQYVEKKREKKRSGWVREYEHPQGVLCKPCPECGYRYGTEWKREEVPDPVLDWLMQLPDTDMTPAWV